MYFEPQYYPRVRDRLQGGKLTTDAFKPMPRKLSTKDRRAANLRRAIISSLRKQGFEVRDKAIQPRENLGKSELRKLHHVSVAHQLKQQASRLRPIEDRLLGYVADGRDLDVSNIRPVLVEVEKQTEEALLFQYLQLHWSIPVSNGYGRRLRFIVFDEYNGKVMGIIGLGDPVYSLKARDEWIGWDQETKKKRLYHVMDAYVLGAIPPYSFLLGTKLMALLALSTEVQRTFRARYRGREALMSGIVRPPYLALVTTSSALGRSSAYNRIKIDGQQFWYPLGFTSGSGDFHFANGLYARIRDFSEAYCEPSAKAEAWGTGFRNRREVIGKCLHAIGLPNKLKYHNVTREVFAAPCGKDALRFLRGEISRPSALCLSVDDIFALFRERWLIPRSERIHTHTHFDREHYRLWK